MVAGDGVPGFLVLQDNDGARPLRPAAEVFEGAAKWRMPPTCARSAESSTAA